MPYSESEQVETVIKLLHCIHANPRLHGKALRDRMKVSKPTIYRLLQAARRRYGVKVEWVKTPDEEFRGYYVIRDWGLLDKEKVESLTFPEFVVDSQA